MCSFRVDPGNVGCPLLVLHLSVRFVTTCPTSRVWSLAESPSDPQPAPVPSAACAEGATGEHMQGQ